MQTETNHMIHEGKNVKRIREILGIKQEALAMELGISQQAISSLEQKEALDKEMLEKVAKALKVSPDAIKEFNEESAVNYFNSFYDNSSNQGAFAAYNNNCTFNTIDKIVELYERMLKERDQLIEQLQKFQQERR
jgi:transcriptional regulator with XRE-family HTH domain